MHGAVFWTSGDAKGYGVAVFGSREEVDIERRVRIVLCRTIAPRAQGIAQVNSTRVHQERIEVDDAYRLARRIEDEVGDFQIPVHELLRCASEHEGWQCGQNILGERCHLGWQLGPHLPQLGENKSRIVEVWDTALRDVIEDCQ